MATILPFVVRPKAPSNARAGDNHAAVIIFPGVRYETVEDGAGKSGPSKARGRAQGKRKGKST